ncbi:MAG: hypothetical protein Q4G58_07745 [bacterium]|nr:hypothetical protein [bacterium]
MTELMSFFVNSRWPMEGYGPICNLNDLIMEIQKEVSAYLQDYAYLV